MQTCDRFLILERTSVININVNSMVMLNGRRGYDVDQLRSMVA